MGIFHSLLISAVHCGSFLCCWLLASIIFEMPHSWLFFFLWKSLELWMFYRLQCKCLRSRFFSFVSLQKSCILLQESPKGFNYTPCNVENIWTSWPWTTFSSRRKKLLGSTRLQSIPWVGGAPRLNDKTDSGKTHLQDLARGLRTSQRVDIPKISQFYWALFEKTRFLCF